MNGDLGMKSFDRMERELAGNRSPGLGDEFPYFPQIYGTDNYLPDVNSRKLHNLEDIGHYRHRLDRIGLEQRHEFAWEQPNEGIQKVWSCQNGTRLPLIHLSGLVCRKKENTHKHNTREADTRSIVQVLSICCDGEGKKKGKK